MDGLLFTSADLDQELIEKENRQKERERIATLKREQEEKEKREKEKKVKVYDKTLFLLDGYSIIYKSYWAFISRPLTDKNGNNISAYYGFFQTLFHILKENTMDGLAITMDEKEPTFRHIMYPEYKANREKAPEDLHKAVEPIKETLRKMNIPVLSMPGFEADDVMASLAKRAGDEGWRTVIVSGDKDLCQLVEDGVSILRPPKKKGENHYTMLDRDGVKAEYGVYPEQIVDYLSLLGDAADNVPGVSGIGEKSATRLLSEYVTLEGIYRHLGDLKENERKKLEEGRENAELSKKLVVLSRDALKNDFSLDSLKRDNFTLSSASEDFEEKNLKSLVIRARAKKDGPTQENVEKVENEIKSEPLLNESEKYLLEKGSYETIKKKEDLLVEFENIAQFKGGVMSLFLLTEDKSSHPLYGFAFSSEIGKAVYVPIGENALSIDDSKDVFERYLSSGRIRIISHSLKDVIKTLSFYGIKVKGEGDTSIEAWLLSSNDGVYTLSAVTAKYFSITLLDIRDITSSLSLSDVDEDLLMRYSSLSADYTYRLERVLSRRLSEKGLDIVYRTLELPLVEVLASMEEEGIYLSLPRIEDLKKTTDTRVGELEDAIYSLAGYRFNINSTMQLSKLLYDERGLEKGKKTMRGYSTDTQTLEGLKKTGDPIISYLLEYRLLSKLKSTYIDVLPSLRDNRGRVHTTFLQTGTATGRLSSRNPNLQNIPVRTDEGRLIRSSFVPEKGRILISADYSQIELVVLAWMSDDDALKKAFLSGEDVHRYTAALIFNKSSVDVTSSERRTAKTINFGIMYGMSAFRLSNELDITRSEAADFISRYFVRYGKVKTFVEKTVKSAEENGYIKTYWGHMREILGIKSSNKTEKAASERTAVNSVIQGTAAEIMKKAMLSIYNEMKERKMKSRMLLQVHDELIFEVVENEIDEMEALIKESMETAASLSVPLKVSIEKGHSWGEMHI